LAAPAVGAEAESGLEGGRPLSDGRTVGVSEASSLDDAQPAITMQAAAMSAAIRFIGFMRLLASGRQTAAHLSQGHEYPTNFTLCHSNMAFFFE